MRGRFAPTQSSCSQTSTTGQRRKSGACTGGPRACKASANPVFDGVMIGFCSTPASIRTRVGWIREECDRIGRDPATVRIRVPLPIAPDFDSEGDTADDLIGYPTYGTGTGDVTVDALRVFLTIFIT